MTLHIFTEEASFEKFSRRLFARLIPDVDVRIYPHQGKQDLERALRTTLPTISKMQGARILITRDQDSDNCRTLKKRLLELIADQCSCAYKIRIVCRELECWMLGDMDAIAKAYPRFKPEQYRHKADFREVDAIADAPDRLLRMIPELKQSRSLPKIAFANNVAPYMDTEVNTSVSFNHFITAVRLLTTD
jgi:hypothetical protein